MKINRLMGIIVYLLNNGRTSAQNLAFVLEKQVATRHEYNWIITALKGMASAYTNKTLEAS